MDLHDAEQLAHRLMAEHLPFKIVGGWQFRWNKRRTSAGLCSFELEQIQLSTYYTEINPEDMVRNTILHEIAHAIAGPYAGHGAEWKAAAIEVGATPEATFEDNHKHQYTWLLTVDGDTDEVVKGYWRKPTKRFIECLHMRRIRGEPETAGRLKVVEGVHDNWNWYNNTEE